MLTIEIIVIIICRLIQRPSEYGNNTHKIVFFFFPKKAKKKEKEKETRLRKKKKRERRNEWVTNLRDIAVVWIKREIPFLLLFFRWLKRQIVDFVNNILTLTN